MHDQSTLRVAVDLERCEGHGVCEDTLREVFRVTDEGKVELIIDHLSAEYRNKLEEAAKYCPTSAITVEEQEAGEIQKEGAFTDPEH